MHLADTAQHLASCQAFGYPSFATSHEHQISGIIVRAQNVLGDVQLGVREEPHVGEVRRWLDDDFTFGANDTSEIPDGIPEVFWFVDRKPVQGFEALEWAMTALVEKRLKLAQAGVARATFAWYPQRFHAGRFIRHDRRSSTGLAGFTGFTWLRHSDQRWFRKPLCPGKPVGGSFDKICCIFTFITLGHPCNHINLVAEGSALDRSTQF